MKLDNFYLSIIFTLITFVTCKRQKSFTKEKDNNNNLIKVAIIGAGAGGSSLSYYLGKLAIDELHRLPFEIDLFEKSPRVGGRIKSLTLEKENKFELGGGVFVNVNYNIMNATQDFDIAYSDTARGEGDFGLYNGQQFVSKLDSSYYNKAQFYYRYGWGFYQASKFANTIKAKFLKLYQSDFPTFNTVEELFQRLEILEYAKKTTREVLINEWRAGEMFTDEMLQAISRNIYTIDNELHALAGAIALIGVDGAYTTIKGNQEIFQQYVAHSFANLHLNSAITQIHKIRNKKDKSKARYTLDINGLASDKVYDYVIIATPYHQSQIKFNKLNWPSEEVQYQPVHEYIIEENTLNPIFFNLKETEAVPSLIFGYNKTLPYTVISQNTQDQIVTISANQKLPEDYLNTLLKNKISKEKITHQPWLAYPKMKILKKGNGEDLLFPKIKVESGLYYLNAMEPAISCMEVETVAAKNIARLILEEVKKDKKRVKVGKN